MTEASDVWPDTEDSEASGWQGQPGS